MPDPSASPWRRAGWLVLASILLLALLLRTLPLTYSHFWDEAVFLQNAKVILGGPDNYSEFDYRPPVLPFLYAAGFLLWDNVYAANLVQGLVTTMVVVFGYLYVRDSFGRVAGLSAAALLAFTPYLVNISHDLLTDAPALAIMLAAMWAFEGRGTRFLLLSGVLYALAIQTRFTSLFLVVYFVLQAFAVHRKPSELLPWAAGAAVAIAPYLVWTQLRFGDVLHPFLLASRITTEWTAPVPASFYGDALAQIFPSIVRVLFALGLVFPLAATMVRDRTSGDSGSIAPAATVGATLARRLVLLVWGCAFLAYMVSIPHKEVRYLLPLFIPMAAIGGLGLAEALGAVARRSRAASAGILVLCIALAAPDYAAPFGKLWKPWVDRSEWEVVQIGRYLNRVSLPQDVIYAAHEFPVLALYSERETVSLLPIQEDFDAQWREFMSKPGYFVYFRPAGIRETHSRSPEFKPDPGFAAAHRQFKVDREFPLAIVYRFDP